MCSLNFYIIWIIWIRMNKSWLSLSVFSDKQNQDIISSYFDQYSLGNHLCDDHITMYFSKNSKTEVNQILNIVSEKYEIIYNWGQLKSENWMDKWKDFFTPVFIDDKVVIIADWDNNDYQAEHIIKICPAMAFGTGHHESTQLVIQKMIDTNIGQFKSLLDLGSGSGILSILAKKMGVDNVTAIEVDPVCKDNFYENCQLSDVSNIDFQIADVHAFDNYEYDIILANIDKNNIIKILDKYQRYNSRAVMILAGLLESDLNEIKSNMKSCQIESINQQGEWISLVVRNVGSK